MEPNNNNSTNTSNTDLNNNNTNTNPNNNNSNTNSTSQSNAKSSSIPTFNFSSIPVFEGRCYRLKQFGKIRKKVHKKLSDNTVLLFLVEMYQLLVEDRETTLPSSFS